MPYIKLRIVGLPRVQAFTEEDELNVKDIQGIIDHIESRYPHDYYTFTIFLNGGRVDERSTDLHDGDEVVIIPTMSGG